jgi:hypothetical protein
MVENKKTPGELLFEGYLAGRGLSFEFEKRYAGKRKRPDYSLIFENRPFLFDVKDFLCKDFPEQGGGYDPIGPIRKKIDEATEKFQEFKDHSCNLVLHNQGAPLVDLCDPYIIFGAMFGNPGFTTPIDTRTGAPVGPTRQAFLDGAKMIHSRRKKPRIDQISALITVRNVNVGSLRLQQYIDGLPDSSEKDSWKSAAALWDHLQSAQLPFDQSETAVGVVVWENVFAATPLPTELFRGPYDVQWTGTGDGISLSFEGPNLKALR